MNNQNWFTIMDFRIVKGLELQATSSMRPWASLVAPDSNK